MPKKWLSLIKGIDFKSLREAFLPYLNELTQFHFSLLNPLFWVFLLLLFLGLSGFWGYRKAFSFSLTIAIILLVTTVLENAVVSNLAKSESFDAAILKVLSLFVILMVTLYYLFIKTD